jgi:glycosyltransferase involved in cell wall biosynthesis
LGDLDGVRVGHFGHFDPDYSRNRIIAKALTRAGAQVLTVTDARTFLFRSPALLHRTLQQDLDLILVGFPGYSDVAVARLISISKGGIPVVADPLVSMYESYVDRFGERIPRITSWRCQAEDRACVGFSNLVLLDTEAHIRYFAGRAHAGREKFHRIWLGADDEIMVPQGSSIGGKFRVFLYASFTPLHGVEHVIRAAQLLEFSGHKVEFRIVGDGQTHGQMQQLASSLKLETVQFLGRRPYSQLPVLMAECDLCLGIFGTTEKAARVVPNKVFDALAVGRAIVTADTPASREALDHREHAWLCPPGNPAALAEAIVALKDDDNERSGIAQRGHELFKHRFSLDALSKELTHVVLGLIDGGRRPRRGPAESSAP